VFPNFKSEIKDIELLQDAFAIFAIRRPVLTASAELPLGSFRDKLLRKNFLMIFIRKLTRTSGRLIDTDTREEPHAVHIIRFRYIWTPLGNTRIED